MSVAVGVAISAAIYLGYEAAISSQESVNERLKSENSKLDIQIKEIKDLKIEIAALKARQEAVEGLQSDRNMPVTLLYELVKLAPDGVYLTKMVQKDIELTLGGVAQSNERVAEFLRNLSSNTGHFSKPALVEIIAGNENLLLKQKQRVSNFVIKVSLERSAAFKFDQIPNASKKEGDEK